MATEPERPQKLEVKSLLRTKIWDELKEAKVRGYTSSSLNDK